MNTRPSHQTRWTTTRSALVGVGLAAAVLGLTACTDETDTSTVISNGSVVSSTSTVPVLIASGMSSGHVR